jgi:biopolymer transport protein ExbD
VQLARRPPRRPRIALTSLVDVVFILLFFFMLASHFLDWRALPVDLAQVSEAPVAPASTPKLVVLLMADDSLRVRGERIERADVLARIEEAAEVIVVPARGTTLQQLVSLLDVLAPSGARVRLGHP